MEARKQSLIDALQRFVAQRPGLEFANYGDVSAYRSEMRSITKDRHHAEELLRAVSWRDSITADDILYAAKHAFSGRLSITEHSTYPETDPLRFVLDYCTGQYWPTEYRRAVCSVLSSALWAYWRDAGDGPVGAARRELPRSIAHRWFN